jgi:1-deoxy-D-xylulose-5-phosphate reductoisomerase
MPLAQQAFQEPKMISILGATGSVGQSTLDLVRQTNVASSGHAHEGPLEIEVLTAQSRVQDLIEVAKEFRPARVVIGDEAHLEELRIGLKGTGIETAAGRTAMLEAATGQASWVMAAIVGAAGLEPTLKAVERGATVALANKECLVSAGDVFMRAVRESHATLLPVDSEHNAIYQVFDFDNPETVRAITLTASGGPFRTWTRNQMLTAKPDQAKSHPNWSMGAKISVDSATLMNKGLELIEAFHLFPVGIEQLSVVIHPQSLVHSFVSYIDGSVLAQLGSPDMRVPIAYTLAWPYRMLAKSEPLDLANLGDLTFEAPDLSRFRALSLAQDALQIGGCAPNILNAANEVAVSRFLAGRIGFLQIVEIVEATMDALLSGDQGQMGKKQQESLHEVIDIDRRAREIAVKLADHSGAA